jgi:hypothetical protein
MDSRYRIKILIYIFFCKYIHIIHRNTQTQYKQISSCTQMFALCGNRTRNLLSTRQVFPPLRQIGRHSFMEIERAQRAILKVKSKWPFRYSTDQLYNESNVLRVRQLFILRAVTTMHMSALSSPDYEHLVQQLVYKIKISSVCSFICKGQAITHLRCIYNTICRKFDLRHLSIIELNGKLFVFHLS